MDDDDAEGRLGQSDSTISMQLGRSSQPRAATSARSDLDATANSGDDFPSPPPPVTVNRPPPSDDDATRTPEVAAGAATTDAAGAISMTGNAISGDNMTGNAISGDNVSSAGNSFTITGDIHSSLPGDSMTGAAAFGLHSPTPPLPQTSPTHPGTGGSLPFGVGQPLSGLHTPGSGLLTPYSPHGGYTPTGGFVDAPAMDDQAFEEGAKLYVQSLSPDSLALDLQNIIQHRKFPQFWSHREVSDALDKLQRQFSSAHGIYAVFFNTLVRVARRQAIEERCIAAANARTEQRWQNEAHTLLFRLSTSEQQRVQLVSQHAQLQAQVAELERLCQAAQTAFEDQASELAQYQQRALNAETAVELLQQQLEDAYHADGADGAGDIDGVAATHDGSANESMSGADTAKGSQEPITASPQDGTSRSAQAFLDPQLASNIELTAQGLATKAASISLPLPTPLKDGTLNNLAKEFKATQLVKDIIADKNHAAKIELTEEGLLSLVRSTIHAVIPTRSILLYALTQATILTARDSLAQLYHDCIDSADPSDMNMTFEARRARAQRQDQHVLREAVKTIAAALSPTFAEYISADTQAMPQRATLFIQMDSDPLTGFVWMNESLKYVAKAPWHSILGDLSKIVFMLITNIADKGFHGHVPEALEAFTRRLAKFERQYGSLSSSLLITAAKIALLHNTSHKFARFAVSELTKRTTGVVLPTHVTAFQTFGTQLPLIWGEFLKLWQQAAGAASETDRAKLLLPPTKLETLMADAGFKYGTLAGGRQTAMAAGGPVTSPGVHSCGLIHESASCRNAAMSYQHIAQELSLLVGPMKKGHDAMLKSIQTCKCSPDDIQKLKEITEPTTKMLGYLESGFVAGRRIGDIPLSQPAAGRGRGRGGMRGRGRGRGGQNYAPHQSAPPAQGITNPPNQRGRSPSRGRDGRSKRSRTPVGRGDWKDFNFGNNCATWLVKGACPRHDNGRECSFDHHVNMKGKFPTLKYSIKFDRGSQPAAGASGTAATSGNAPKCATCPNTTGRKADGSGWLTFCRNCWQQKLAANQDSRPSQGAHSAHVANNPISDSNDTAVVEREVAATLFNSDLAAEANAMRRALLAGQNACPEAHIVAPGNHVFMGLTGQEASGEATSVTTELDITCDTVQIAEVIGLDGLHAHADDIEQMPLSYRPFDDAQISGLAYDGDTEIIMSALWDSDLAAPAHDIRVQHLLAATPASVDWNLYQIQYFQREWPEWGDMAMGINIMRETYGFDVGALDCDQLDLDYLGHLGYHVSFARNRDRVSTFRDIHRRVTQMLAQQACERTAAQLQAQRLALADPEVHEAAEAGIDIQCAFCGHEISHVYDSTAGCRLRVCLYCAHTATNPKALADNGSFDITVTPIDTDDSSPAAAGPRRSAARSKTLQASSTPYDWPVSPEVQECELEPSTGEPTTAHYQQLTLQLIRSATTTSGLDILSSRLNCAELRLAWQLRRRELQQSPDAQPDVEAALQRTEADMQHVQSSLDENVTSVLPFECPTSPEARVDETSSSDDECSASVEAVRHAAQSYRKGLAQRSAPLFRSQRLFAAAPIFTTAPVFPAAPPAFDSANSSSVFVFDAPSEQRLPARAHAPRNVSGAAIRHRQQRAQKRIGQQYRRAYRADPQNRPLYRRVADPYSTASTHTWVEVSPTVEVRRLRLRVNAPRHLYFRACRRKALRRAAVISARDRFVQQLQARNANIPWPDEVLPSVQPTSLERLTSGIHAARLALRARLLHARMQRLSDPAIRHFTGFDGQDDIAKSSAASPSDDIGPAASDEPATLDTDEGPVDSPVDDGPVLDASDEEPRDFSQLADQLYALSWRNTNERWGARGSAGGTEHPCRTIDPSRLPSITSHLAHCAVRIAQQALNSVIGVETRYLLDLHHGDDLQELMALEQRCTDLETAFIRLERDMFNRYTQLLRELSVISLFLNDQDNIINRRRQLIVFEPQPAPYAEGRALSSVAHRTALRDGMLRNGRVELHARSWSSAQLAPPRMYDYIVLDDVIYLVVFAPNWYESALCLSRRYFQLAQWLRRQLSYCLAYTPIGEDDEAGNVRERLPRLTHKPCITDRRLLARWDPMLDFEPQLHGATMLRDWRTGQASPSATPAFMCSICGETASYHHHRASLICEICYSFRQPLAMWHDHALHTRFGPPALRSTANMSVHDRLRLSGINDRGDWDQPADTFAEPPVVQFLRDTELLRFRSDMSWVWAQLGATPMIASLRTGIRVVAAHQRAVQIAWFKHLCPLRQDGSQADYPSGATLLQALPPEMLSVIFPSDDEALIEIRTAAEAACLWPYLLEFGLDRQRRLLLQRNYPSPFLWTPSREIRFYHDFLGVLDECARAVDTACARAVDTALLPADRRSRFLDLLHQRLFHDESHYILYPEGFCLATPRNLARTWRYVMLKVAHLGHVAAHLYDFNPDAALPDLSEINRFMFTRPSRRFPIQRALGGQSNSDAFYDALQGLLIKLQHGHHASALSSTGMRPSNPPSPFFVLAAFLLNPERPWIIDENAHWLRAPAWLLPLETAQRWSFGVGAHQQTLEQPQGNEDTAPVIYEVQPSGDVEGFTEDEDDDSDTDSDSDDASDSDSAGADHDDDDFPDSDDDRHDSRTSGAHPRDTSADHDRHDNSGERNHAGATNVSRASSRSGEPVDVLNGETLLSDYNDTEANAMRRAMLTGRTACPDAYMVVPGCREFIGLPDPRSTFMRLSSTIARMIDFDEETQSYISAFPASRLLDFLSAYNVSAGRQFRDVIIHLLDSGASTGLSPIETHFFLEIKCNEVIEGIGDRRVECFAPLVFSILAAQVDPTTGEQVDGLKYVSMTLQRTYKLPSLGFPLFPSGRAEAQGYIFVLKHNNPYMMGPNGLRAPLIKDYVTGLTWIPERVYAKPTVEIKKAFLVEYASNPNVLARRPELIGEPEKTPVHLDTKESFDLRIREHSHRAVENFYHAMPPDEAQTYVLNSRNDRTDDSNASPRRSARIRGRPDSPARDPAPPKRSEARSSASGPNQCEGKRNNDDELYRKARAASLIQRPRAQIKLPVIRFLDNGEPHVIQNFMQWLHSTCSHLIKANSMEAIKYCADAEIAEAVRDLSNKKPGQPLADHCDGCMLYRGKVNPRPQVRTAPGRGPRPREDDIYLDICGRVDQESIFHGFHYYMAAVTRKGFIIVHGLTYKNQSLFVIARLFNDLGGAPKHTHVDGAGELNSAIARDFFASCNTSLNSTESDEQWRNGMSERAHGTLKGCTNATLHYANAPLAFWYLALSHVALLANVFRLARVRDPIDGKPGRTMEMTVYEAHYGEKPSFAALAIGPFGCLAFVVLTSEQRQARGFDKSWSPKAIAGMYMGIWHNSRKGIFHYLMFDGSRILETTSNIQVIGDCLPWKLQLGREAAANLNLNSDPIDDDDDDDNAPPACAHCGIASSSAIYEHAVSRADVAHQRNAARQLAFCHAFDPTTSGTFAAAYNAQRDQERAERTAASRMPKRALQRSIQNAPTSSADAFAPSTKQDDATPLDHPRDFKIQECPPIWRIAPSNDHEYRIAEATVFSDSNQVPTQVTHPYERYVGRRVRKAFLDHSPIPFEGTVTRLSRHRSRNLFFVKYDDGDSEEMDLLELLEHIILNKDHGDDPSEHGQTRWQLNDNIAMSAIAFAVLVEAADHIPDTQESHNRYRCNAHIAMSLDGTLIATRDTQPDIPSPKPARHVSFNNQAQTQIVQYPDTERAAKLASSTAVKGRRNMPRSDYDICSNEIGCACQKCQYFWEIRDGSVIWSEVLASKFVSNPSALGQPPFQHTKTELEVILTRKMRDQQGIDDAPASAAPAQPPEESWTPLDWNGVLRHPQTELVQASARTEMQQIFDTGTGVYATDEEIAQARRDGMLFLRAKMVYKLKYKTIELPDGTLRDVPHKWKARLAAVGCREREGLDFANSTFSPTIGMTAVRTLVALCCDPKFDLRSYDLSGAYLGTPLKRPVFIILPPDAGEDAGKILRCEKAIYGLRDSSAAFVKYLGEQLMSFRYKGFGFKKLHMDQCIYHYEDDEGNIMMFCHYVDDLAIASTNNDLRDQLLKHINATWSVTDEGALQRFVGINFWRSPDKMTWSMTLAPYIDKIAKRFQQEHAAPSDVPIDPGFILTPEDLQEVPTPEMISEYRSLIGSIGFAAITVRFDIAYAVSVLSRHLARPCRKVINEAKRCIRYLIGTRDFAVRWSTHPDSLADKLRNVLWASADASYAADPITRRSHGGYIAFLNSGPIAWKSGLQKLVCLSSAESEFVALTSCIVEVRYLRMLLAELHFPQEQPTTILEDNRAAIIIAEGTVSSNGRAKHIDVRFKHAAENVRNGTCVIHYIASAWNYSDIMTKALAPTKLRSMRDLCVTPASRPASTVRASTDLVDRLAACCASASASHYFLYHFDLDD